MMAKVFQILVRKELTGVLSFTTEQLENRGRRHPHDGLQIKEDDVPFVKLLSIGGGYPLR